MTIHQQAHGLIDMLSEESAEVIVQVMLRMLPYDRRPVYSPETAFRTEKTISGSKVTEPVKAQQAAKGRLSPEDLARVLAQSGLKGAEYSADPLSEDVDEINNELSDFFGTDPMNG